MAEYIEKAEIEKWGTCIAERNDKQELRPRIGIHLLPTADVIERSKIDKTIEEIEDLGKEMDKVQFTKYLVPLGDILEIIKRNIGE